MSRPLDQSSTTTVVTRRSFPRPGSGAERDERASPPPAGVVAGDPEGDASVATPVVMSSGDGPSVDVPFSMRTPVVEKRILMDEELEGWTREDRVTANARKYTVYLSPSGGQFDSRRKALQSLGIAVTPNVREERFGAQRARRESELYGDGETATDRRSDPPDAPDRALCTALYEQGAASDLPSRSLSERPRGYTDPLANVFGRKRKRRRHSHCQIGEDGEEIPRQPKRSYIGPPVPSFCRVPAGDDLPNWTVERATASDGLQFLLYKDPYGTPVGSRSSALFVTGQLEVPRTHRQQARHLLREADEHRSRLGSTLCVPPKIAADMRSKPERRWKDGEYASLVEKHFGKAARQNYERVPSTPKLSHRVVVVDLFCGIGGLSLGMRAGGFPHVFGVDSDGGCIAAYRKNDCGARSAEQTVRITDIEKWAKAFEEAGCAGTDAKVELVIVAAPPCQPYSQAGPQSGSSDERDCLRTVIDLVTRVRPLAVVIENVPKMMAAAHSYWVQPLLQRLTDARYNVHAAEHSCAIHSVPQTRRRLIVSAVRCDALSDPDATSAVAARLRIPASNQHRPPTASDALDDEPQLWEGVRPADLTMTLTAIRSRLRLRSDSDVTGLVSPYAPAPTIVTTAGSDHTYFRLVALPRDTAPEDMTFGHARSLERRHLLRLQSFPNDFVLYGHKRAQSAGIGNAVPPLFAYDLALGLKRLLAACTRSSMLSTATPSVAAECCRLCKEYVLRNVEA